DWLSSYSSGAAMLSFGPWMRLRAITSTRSRKPFIIASLSPGKFKVWPHACQTHHVGRGSVVKQGSFMREKPRNYVSCPRGSICWTNRDPTSPPYRTLPRERLCPLLGASNCLKLIRQRCANRFQGGWQAGESGLGPGRKTSRITSSGLSDASGFKRASTPG